MTPDDITLSLPVDPEAELDRLAALYLAAGGPGMRLLTALGGRAEGLLSRLPPELRGKLGAATEQALTLSVRAAQSSRGRVPDQPGWVDTALTTAMGAAGGFAGLPGALVELPATTTMLLRTIQGVAAQSGFDPAAENVQFDCIQVFASAGPLSHDDGADTGFLALRLTLTGGAMQKLIAQVSPRLAVVLGQKLAAQSVPVLGAVAGAGTNFLFTRYYQQMALVHFGLRRLAIDADIPHAELTERLAARMAPVRL